ncbi:MAG: putative sugar nucleotidyl transferase [Candidatus Sumerlaeia bacterium]|nr:putative sugar nucleotidyl transferase [Candidatus Sumerlaeia bacterium]
MNFPAYSLIVYEDYHWINFLPLVYFRPIQELLCGGGSLFSRVEILAQQPMQLWCRPSLEETLLERGNLAVNQPVHPEQMALFLNGRGLWSSLPSIDNSPHSEGWVGVDSSGEVACVALPASVAECFSPSTFLDEQFLHRQIQHLPRVNVSRCVRLMRWPWELIHTNAITLMEDWEFRQHAPTLEGCIMGGVHLLSRDQIHVGKGCKIYPCVVIDAEAGPVVLEEGVTVMPHSFIQGPAHIGKNTLLQTGAVIRGGTTIGPVCKVGGEVEGSIIHGYSNKQHDGFLGHSYLGEWINIAADCINSDLKNTYGTIRVPINGVPVETGEIFMGMLVGDHSKIGINVSIPTGAVVGVSSSVFDPACPKFVPSFSWVEKEGTATYEINRAVEVARKMMARRRKMMTAAMEALFRVTQQESLAREFHLQSC